ncbi:hypothetical protein BaRGS_00000173 [Batillaria attramentaria]|uniref:Apyrase n=1 Tax=Batillaria attramentaria TaxID=370345 RepID=A0ABD0MA08_9CAEN
MISHLVVFLFFPNRIYCSPCLQAKDRTKKLTLLVLLAVIAMSLLTLVISGLLTISVFKRNASGVQSMESSSSPDAATIHYGIVIDCGSSGSRVYVYYWPPHSGNPADLLNIQQLLDSQGKPVMKKVSPGLSEFDDNPDDASEHIKQLLQYVVDYIPKEKHKETPLYILATAGMRMISKEAACEDENVKIGVLAVKMLPRFYGEYRSLSNACFPAWAIRKSSPSHLSVAHFTMPRLSAIERQQAIGRLNAGQSVADVARALQVHSVTIHRLARRYQATGSVDDRPRAGRPRILTPRQQRAVVRSFRQNPFQSAAAVGRHLISTRNRVTSRQTVSRVVVRADLYCHRPYRGQVLTARHRRNRLNWTLAHRQWRQESQEAILKDLQKDVTKDFDFLVAENHFEVISGKTEGVYAWIAVNYALNRFSHTAGDGDMIGVKLADGKIHHRSRTVGMIDMGGGSVQIAFEVTNEEQMQKIPSQMIAEFNLGCQEADVEHTYRVYVTTFLGYGANSAIDRYQAALARNATSASKARSSSKKSRPLPDPCLPAGMPLTTEADEEKPARSFIGTGDYMECKARMELLLNVSVPCSRDPCSINGVHQPEIDFVRSQFYGFSEFWYSMEDVYRKGGLYRYPIFEKLATDFCSTSWTKLEAEYECIKSAWMSVVLHKGFRFPITYENFQSAQLINGKDVQWTLGALIYRTRFLPLRDIEHDLKYHSSHWMKSQVFYNEYLIILCFVIVLAAIFLYMKRLRLCPRRADMSRVPSMSYFMTEENQMEQGVRYIKGNGYL